MPKIVSNTLLGVTCILLPGASRNEADGLGLHDIASGRPRVRWPDERFSEELKPRPDRAAAGTIVSGPSTEKSIASLRSFLAEPTRLSRLFLAGDAAHIVPPTGAKGLNLAASDAHYLSQASAEFYQEKSIAGLDGYSDRALAPIWQAERFSWWMTRLLRRFPEDSGFDHKVQRAEIEYLARSPSAQTALPENHVGLPY